MKRQIGIFLCWYLSFNWFQFDSIFGYCQEESFCEEKFSSFKFFKLFLKELICYKTTDKNELVMLNKYFSTEN